MTLEITYDEHHYEGSPHIPTVSTCAKCRYNITITIRSP